jgi:arylformamidase
MAVDYDQLYNPRHTVADFPGIMARWAAESERARANTSCVLDVPYGPAATEKVDIFKPKGASRALLMFIHGGYWRLLDKRDHSFVAPAFTQAGVTVAVPNYALCPAVTVMDIAMQMVQCVAWLYRNGGHFGAPYRQVYVSGHSAGGHLTAMMLAALWPTYASDLPKKTVQAGFSISGVFDIAPIRHVPIVQNDVRLTDEVIARASPAYLPPATDAPLYTAVGGKENEGFHIQNRLIQSRWKKVHKADIACPGDDHFSILDKFGTAGTPIHRAALGMMGIV